MISLIPASQSYHVALNDVCSKLAIPRIGLLKDLCATGLGQ